MYKKVAHIEINPVPAPRQSRRDAFKPSPMVQRYRAFRDVVRLEGRHVAWGSAYRIIFYMPMPKSWGKKKRAKMMHQPHQQTPDLDNLVKALLDSLPFDKGDAHVHHVDATKIWSDVGWIMIRVLDL